MCLCGPNTSHCSVFYCIFTIFERTGDLNSTVGLAIWLTRSPGGSLFPTDVFIPVPTQFADGSTSTVRLKILRPPLSRRRHQSHLAAPPLTISPPLSAMAFSPGGKFYGSVRWIICRGIKSLVTIVVGAVLMDRVQCGWKWGHYGFIKRLMSPPLLAVTLNLLLWVYCLSKLILCLRWCQKRAGWISD